MLGDSKRSNEIEIARGKLVGHNGPGSIYVNVEGDSYIISAVDNWYKNGDGINKEDFKIKDDRLTKLLGVSHFYEVPPYKYKKSKEKINHEMKIPVFRFPLLHYCRFCNRFQTLKPDNYKRKAYCNHCRDQKEFLQFPIVIACEHGHISDFPYLDYLHRHSKQVNTKEHSVQLVKVGQSILDWKLKCSCGEFKSLSGITGSSTTGEDTPYQKEMGGVLCKGERPWTEKDSIDKCEAKPAAILKNALNTYQAETVQALIITNHDATSNRDMSDIYEEEFDRLSLKINDEDYEKLKVAVSFKGKSKSIIKSINSVSRLEELLVQTGFHRLSPSDEEESLLKLKEGNNYNVLFNENKNHGWFPAKKQFGEGIFIEFNEDILSEWEQKDIVQKRFEKLKSRTENFYLQPKFNSPSSVMIHTLSHALIREMSVHSGYSISSIREKLYLNEGKKGLLIYVTDTDKDGTYGGLVRLSEKLKFENIFNNSLRELDWCSSDPVCFEIGKTMGQGVNYSNGSACHNCNYIPSTSCNYRNCFLDRDFVGRKEALENISNYYNWFSSTDKHSLELDFENYSHFTYSDWNEVPNYIEEDSAYFIEERYNVPTYLDGKMSVNAKAYEFKYLWEKEKIIIVNPGSFQDNEISLPLEIDGWLIYEI